jgi:copper chaperone
MTHTYKFNVAMSCGGCSGAIERVLKKLEGQSLRQSQAALCAQTHANDLRRC